MADDWEYIRKTILALTLESPSQAMRYFKDLIGGDLEERVHVFERVYRLKPASEVPKPKKRPRRKKRRSGRRRRRRYVVMC